MVPPKAGVTLTGAVIGVKAQVEPFQETISLEVFWVIGDDVVVVVVQSVKQNS